MHGRHHRAPRVDHQAHAGGEEAGSSSVPVDPGAEPLRRGRPAARPSTAERLMPAFSKVAPSDQHAGDAAAAARPVPAVLPESPPAVEAGEERGRLVVQPLHQRRHPVARSARSPCAHGARHSLHRVDERAGVLHRHVGMDAVARGWRCAPGRRTRRASRACASRIVAGGA